MPNFQSGAKLAVTAGILGVGLVMAAIPSAYADGLGGISGWQPSPDICADQNQIPILVTNASQIEQTGSITVNDNLAANVQVFETQAALGDASWCGNDLDAGQGYSYNFTVQPGQTAVYWAALGGVDSNDYKGSQAIAIGGLPSNTSGASWYDFFLNLKSTLGFEALQVQYDHTGGTNTSTNNQNNFNVIPCNTSNGGVQPGYGTLTPFAAAQAEGPTYYTGDPICLAWLPEGEMVAFENAGADGYTITAAQENTTLNSFVTVDFAGTYTGPVNSMQYRYQTDFNNVITQTETVDLPFLSGLAGTETTATFAFTFDGKWGAVNIPTPVGEYGEVQLFVNDTTYVGSVSFDNN